MDYTIELTDELKAELDIYKAADPLNPTDRFYVCWMSMDIEGNPETGLVDRGEEWAEGWLEARKMIEYYPLDGLRYFVGDKNAQPVLPSYREVREMLDDNRRLNLDPMYHEVLAVKLLFG